MNTARSDIFRRFNEFWSGDESLTAFLFLLFLAIFLGPFVDSGPVRLLTSMLFSLLMIAGVVNMSQHASIRFTAGMIAVIAITLRWLKHVVPTPTIVKLGTVAALIFLIMLAGVTLSKVFSKGRVTSHKIKGAIAVYLLFGLVWSLLYGLLDQLLPNAFNLPPGGDAFTPGRQETLTYFSFVTLTTMGYGDITPAHEISRMFVVMEGLFGQLYPATLLARLVSLELMSQGDA
jgi:hypothetical protein